jgi:hypothetical protein
MKNPNPNPEIPELEFKSAELEKVTRHMKIVREWLNDMVPEIIGSSIDISEIAAVWNDCPNDEEIAKEFISQGGSTNERFLTFIERFRSWVDKTEEYREKL